jgi:NAD(P)-dependent dehydrogenase (short-subunit alcohol dehydrogenase family)
MEREGMFDLSGKKAMVTGAASGIGRASALAMARAGADVAIIDLNEELGRQTSEEIKALGRKSLFIKADVSIPEQAAAMVRQVVEGLDGLHIAHNNVGIGANPCALTDDGALGVWQRIIEVNLSGMFYCCREQARHMIPQRYGKIVNTGSMSGTIVNNFELGGAQAGGVGMIAYCTSKAGVKHLTKALAVELIPHNIYVNSISPGYTITPATRLIQDTPAFLEKENSTTPIHRQARAEEMAGGVVYLVSDAASYTTGHDLVMDGGHTIW